MEVGGFNLWESDWVPIVQMAVLGPKAGLDRCRKISPPLGFDPRTVQPVASSYIAYDIPVH